MDDRLDSMQEARRLFSLYPEGKEIPVYYKSWNPKDCLLEPGPLERLPLRFWKGFTLFFLGLLILLKSSEKGSQQWDDLGDGGSGGCWGDSGGDDGDDGGGGGDGGDGGGDGGDD